MNAREINGIANDCSDSNLLKNILPAVNIVPNKIANVAEVSVEDIAEEEQKFTARATSSVRPRNRSKEFGRSVDEFDFNSLFARLERCRDLYLSASAPSTDYCNRPINNSDYVVEVETNDEIATTVDMNVQRLDDVRRKEKMAKVEEMVEVIGNAISDMAVTAAEAFSSLTAHQSLSSANKDRVRIEQYSDERQMPDIMRLMTKELSEPYSIYTYRYFIHNWPQLCLLAFDTEAAVYVGAIVCKLDWTRHNRHSGYIAMLAVDETCRRMKIGTRLVEQAIKNMHEGGCDEVVLETEVTNGRALGLYENLGFLREKRLFRYYLNGVDAFRLKLYFTAPVDFYWASLL